MSKDTMVAVLLEHAEIYWDHKSGKACCYGCDEMLCDLTEAMEVQGLKLVEHQADEMLSAGLGLIREAKLVAWDVGMTDAKLLALGIRTEVRNPYVG